MQDDENTVEDLNEQLLNHLQDVAIRLKIHEGKLRLPKRTDTIMQFSKYRSAALVVLGIVFMLVFYGGFIGLCVAVFCLKPLLYGIKFSHQTTTLKQVLTCHEIDAGIQLIEACKNAKMATVKEQLTEVDYENLTYKNIKENIIPNLRLCIHHE